MKNLRLVLLCSLFVFLAACGGNPTQTSKPTIEPPQPLSTSRDSTSFTMTNTASSSLSFTITVQNDGGNPQPDDWFTVDPKSGTIQGNGQRDITLTLVPNLKAGTYSSTLTISYPGGSTPFEVTGTVGGGGGATGAFSLATDNVTNSLSPGAGVQIPITIMRSGGFADAVELDIVGAPEGVSGTFAPNPVSGNESTLTVTTQNSVAAGMYSLSVRGTSGSLNATTKVDVNVVGTTTEPTFGLALSPASLSSEVGKTVTSTVTVNKTSSFSSSVNLSASGAPSGVTVSFDPSSTNSTSKVSVKVGSGVKAGNYTLTIKGSGGNKTASTKLGLTVLGKSAGTGRITGTVQTDNAKISLTPTPVNNTMLRDLRVDLGQTDRPDYVAGQLLIQYRDSALTTSRVGSYEALAETVQQDYGLSVLHPGTLQQPSLVEVAPGQSVEGLVERLEQDPRIAYAEPNYYIYTQAVPNDPEVSKLWNMPVSGLPVAWSFKNSASNVTVAVLDTGIQTNHTDLQGVFVGGYDFCASNNCSQTDTNPQPDSADDRHGTHVTGTLAAVGNNGNGVAGVLYGGAKIVPVKVFYQASFTTADALAQAIRWAAGETVRTSDGKNVSNPNPAKIINLSLGTQQQSATLENAVKAAQGRGVLLVAAAGNVGGNSLFYPARYSGVLAVGAVNSKFQRSCFSNYGSGLDIMAAGGDGFLQNSACSGRNNEAILSTLPGNNYGYEAGTSMATPLVAGVAALVLSQNPSFSAAQVTDQLKKTAYFDSSTMTADQYGAGVVRADLAFGFPGPGDSVSVTATGAGSAVATVKLQLGGESTPFTLDSLAAGSYTVKADASGSSRSLAATKTVSLSGGSQSVTLQLEP